MLTEYLGAMPETAEPRLAATDKLTVEEQDVVSLLKAAASAHGEVDGWTLTSHAGNVIKRQRPDFSPRLFGCRTLGQVINRFDRYFELRRVARGDGMADQFRERPEPA
jgi:hypothetical protein